MAGLFTYAVALTMSISKRFVLGIIVPQRSGIVTDVFYSRSPVHSEQKQFLLLGLLALHLSMCVSYFVLFSRIFSSTVCL